MEAKDHMARTALQRLAMPPAIELEDHVDDDRCYGCTHPSTSYDSLRVNVKDHSFINGKRS